MVSICECNTFNQNIWFSCGTTNISMANADQVKNQTGFSIGGVAPIAHINKLRVLIDNSLSRFDDIYAAAGHPYSIFKISYSQLCNITNGEVLDIV